MSRGLACVLRSLVFTHKPRWHLRCSIQPLLQFMFPLASRPGRPPNVVPTNVLLRPTKPSRRPFPQHVHACLMKQASSAKKTRLAGDATPSASRPSGIAHRSSLQFDGSSDPGKSSTPRPERGPGVRRAEGTGSSANRQEGPTGPSEGPRSTRVSLQGVFSPKVSR